MCCEVKMIHLFKAQRLKFLLQLNQIDQGLTLQEVVVQGHICPSHALAHLNIQFSSAQENTAHGFHPLILAYSILPFCKTWASS